MAVGEHHLHYVNAVKTAELFDRSAVGRGSMNGLLAIQSNNTESTVVQFKNIWLKRLGPEATKDESTRALTAAAAAERDL